MKRKLAIGLLWHSDSSGNLGVGALTVGHMALIEQAAARADVDTELHLFRPGERLPSYVRDGFASRHDINGRFMVSPGGYWAALKPLDIMLDIGAGDSFADIYPDKRFAYITATKEMCLLRGVPLVLAPQTIGPFSRQPHSALAGHLMKRARAVFARDPMSLDAIHRLAPGANAMLAIDVAFALPHSAAQRGPGVRAGVNVSGLLYSGGYGGGNDYGLTVDYRAFTSRLIEGLLARGARVELIPHVASTIARDDDASACAEVHRLYPETVVVQPFSSPSDAKSHISGLDFLVAGRMHASIAAWSAGVPVVPVSYSRKFEGLYCALGYPWLIPAKGLSTDEAVARTLDAFDRRSELAVSIEQGRPVVEAGLETYVGYLARLFGELAR